MAEKNTAGRGRFIVFEGIDGCGKTTQVERLISYITEETGRRCLSEREPDSRDIVGAIIRTALYGSVKITPEAMAYLHVADRLEHIAYMTPLLGSGENIVCDRYYLSNMAYNATEDLSVEEIYALNAPCVKKLPPDLVIFLDIDPEVTARRRHAGRSDEEIYDAMEKQISIRNNYKKALAIAEKDGVRVAVINADQSIDKVSADIIAAYKAAF